MGTQRDLRMLKVLPPNITSTECIIITATKKFTKGVKYIHDNKSWERCYVFMKILFTCLRVLRLADSNLSGMYKV